MKNGSRGALVAVVLLVVVLVGGVVGYNALSSARAAQVASEAQDEPVQSQTSQDNALMLADYDATVYTDLGEPVLLSALADGKPLVINFWATWCPYCVNEMGDYQQLYHLYGDRVSFAFVDCGYNNGETVEKAMDYLANNGLADMPAYYDTDAEAMNSFGAWSLPTTVVVSADGEILANSAGQIDVAKMDAALSSLVG